MSKKYANYFKDRLFLNKFAQGFKDKVRDNWDVVIVITGYNGVGKSSLAWALSNLIDDAFNMKKQTLWSEGSEEAIELIQELDNYKVIWYDEAVHQFSNDEWFSKDSKQFGKEYTVNRSENKVHILCIPDFEKLTKYMRDYRVRYHFHVYDRGKALFRMKDTTNPVKRSSWNDEYLKKYLEKRFYSKGKTPSTKDIVASWKRMSNAHKRIVYFPKMPSGLENKYNALKDQRKRRSLVQAEESKKTALSRKYQVWIQKLVTLYGPSFKVLREEIGMSKGAANKYRVYGIKDTKRTYNNPKMIIKGGNK